MKANAVIVISISLLFLACSGGQKAKTNELNDASGQAKEKVSSVNRLANLEDGQVGIYYFRTSLRCETCEAIEQIVKGELDGTYAEKVKKGEIVFRQFNLDDEKVADFALQYDVVFKSLIILNNEKHINLTNEAFLYALTKPEKLKGIIEKNIDKLL